MNSRMTATVGTIINALIIAKAATAAMNSPRVVLVCLTVATADFMFVTSDCSGLLSSIRSYDMYLTARPRDIADQKLSGS